MTLDVEPERELLRLLRLPVLGTRLGIVGAADRAISGLARTAMLGTLDRWSVGDLTVHLPDGRVLQAGGISPGPSATMWIRDDRFFRKLALQGPLWVGESYMDGDWHADDLAALMELGVLNQSSVPTNPVLTRLGNLANYWFGRGRVNTRDGARENVHEHYDLSNDLFALFLDETMAYSCAIFENEAETLVQAQLHKFQALAERLRLGPSDHLLEIGCGWGGFAMYAAQTYGCRVTGVTISREQYELARERVTAAGLADCVEIQLCDYRDVVGTYSKIVSIEMLEAVGQHYWREYFRVLDRLLEPGGLVALQTIAVADHEFQHAASHASWVQKYIFPGGMLPSLLELCRAMSADTKLSVIELEDIGPHYAPTLRLWREAFMSQLPAVRALGFGDRYIRMWEFYLAASEARFRTRTMSDFHLVLARPGRITA